MERIERWTRMALGGQLMSRADIDDDANIMNPKTAVVEDRQR